MCLEQQLAVALAREWQTENAMQGSNTAMQLHILLQIVTAWQHAQQLLVPTDPRQWCVSACAEVAAIPC